MNGAAVERKCLNPPLNEAVPAACFGQLSEAECQEIALHMLECDVCAEDFERLAACVNVLRSEPRLPPMRLTPEAVSALNVSGRLELPLSGHARFVGIASALYGALYCASAWTELGYSYDKFATLAWATSILCFGWAAGVALLSLALVSSRFRRAPTTALAWGACALLFGIGGLVALLWALLPAEPTIAARFATRSAFGGYLKNVVFYFLPVGIAFLVWPFHVVVGLQRETSEGRSKNVWRLLTKDRQAFSPPGVWFVPVGALVGLLLLAVAIGIQGTQNMLDNLLPGPYANLFTTALYLRVGLWYVVALAGFLWYVRCLNDLKREALAMEKLLNTPGPSDESI